MKLFHADRTTTQYSQMLPFGSLRHRLFFNNRECAVKFMTRVFFLIYFRMRGRLF